MISKHIAFAGRGNGALLLLFSFISLLLFIVIILSFFFFFLLRLLHFLFAPSFSATVASNASSSSSPLRNSFLTILGERESGQRQKNAGRGRVEGKGGNPINGVVSHTPPSYHLTLPFRLRPPPPPSLLRRSISTRSSAVFVTSLRQQSIIILSHPMRGRRACDRRPSARARTTARIKNHFTLGANASGRAQPPFHRGHERARAGANVR